MNAKPTIASPRPIDTVLAATIAAIFAFGILWAIVILFQSRGAPMGRLVAAECACAHHAYQSERASCMRQWLADAQAMPVAKQ